METEEGREAGRFWLGKPWIRILGTHLTCLHLRGLSKWSCLGDCQMQVLGPAMSSELGPDIGEAFLEVKNLREHEKVLSEKCRTES